MVEPLSVEEINYIRLTLLLNGLTVTAVRTFFDKEFPPTNLPSTLNAEKVTLENLKFKNQLTRAQWILLFPTTGKPTSVTFDVTLMICLIRNLTSINPPINGFDSLPLSVETSLGSHLARIKFYRNKLVHHGSITIDTAFFNTAWGHITDAVGQLGDPTMKHECQELKVKIFDQSNLPSYEKLLRDTIGIMGSGQLELTNTLEQFTRLKQLSTVETLKMKQNNQYHGTSKNTTMSVEEQNVASNPTSADTVKWNAKTGYINLGLTERGSFPTIPGDSLDSKKEKRQRVIKCIMITLIFMVIVGCISGTVVWIIHNKYFLDSKDSPPTIMTDSPSSPDKCDNDISTATIGEQICIPFTQKFTSNPSRVHVRQVSSQYCIELQGFSVSFSSDNFVQRIGDWIINFNSSRTDQQFRFVKEKATCDSIGIYEITLDYGVDNFTSFEFEIRLKDPTLQQNVTRIRDIIHVHCEMTIACTASSLALVVNHEPSATKIPAMNVCSNNDITSRTKFSVDADIHISRFSESQTISCVPLMKNIELAANLTTTTAIPFCEGDICVPGCKEDPQSESYYSHTLSCNRFYQCSNGKLVSHTCSESTYWSPSKCICDHFDDAICDQKTKLFSKPSMSKKCKSHV